MKKVILFVLLTFTFVSFANAQGALPKDRSTVGKYHTYPHYTDQESHPFRIFSYALYPIGWVLREGITRPLSYITSLDETESDIFGHRDVNDWKDPSCFSDTKEYDCKSVAPFKTIDATGCVNGNCNVGADGSQFEVEKVYLPDVNFDFDKRELNTLGKGKARVIAQILKEKAGVNVVLSGHADYKGSDEYNKKLALDRAEALKKELVRLGVPQSRIQTISFGKERPFLQEKDDPARAVNRRVEISF